MSDPNPHCKHTNRPLSAINHGWVIDFLCPDCDKVLFSHELDPDEVPE